MIALRDYQSNALEGLRQAMRDGHSRMILCAATGSGKSVCAAELARLHAEKGTRLVFVVDRRVLVEQFSRHLDSFGLDHGVWMAGHYRWRPQKNIQVCSAQTLERSQEWPACDTLVIDEAHALMRKSLIAYIKARKEMAVIGLTATPLTKGLGQIYTKVVNVRAMKDLVADGFLVPFKVFAAKEIDTTGVKIVAGEWQKDEVEERARILVGDVVSEYTSLSNNVFGGQRKTIVFSAGVAHGEDLARQFNQAGYAAMSISYKTKEEDKQEVLREFAKANPSFNVLISCDILTRGFDVPDVEHVILARPVRESISLHIQMIGRGARPAPLKQFCVIQDHAGNYLRFRDQFDEIFDRGVEKLTDDAEKAPRELTAREKLANVCPRCKSIWPKESDTCTHCGFERTRKSMVKVLPGVMREIQGAVTNNVLNDLKKEIITDWYAQLIWYQEQQGYKDGWAWHKMHEKFGICPKLKPEPKFMSREVGNWLRSRQIAWSKARKKAGGQSAVY